MTRLPRAGSGVLTAQGHSRYSRHSGVSLRLIHRWMGPGIAKSHTSKTLQFSSWTYPKIAFDRFWATGGVLADLHGTTRPDQSPMQQLTPTLIQRSTTVQEMITILTVSAAES